MGSRYMLLLGAPPNLGLDMLNMAGVPASVRIMVPYFTIPTDRSWYVTRYLVSRRQTTMQVNFFMCCNSKKTRSFIPNSGPEITLTFSQEPLTNWFIPRR